MGKEQRTPAQIIGADALTQLIFEGYEVVPARRSSDEQAEVAGWTGRRGDYPLGTRALSIDCGHWTRVDGGWKWHLGDVFPSLGADAYRIEIPASPPAVAAGGVTEEQVEAAARSLAADHYAHRFQRLSRW